MLRRVRAVLAEPLLLFGRRRAIREHQIADVHEPVQIAGTRYGKPEHAQAANLRFAARVVVLPRDVVLRAGRDDE